MIERPPPPPCQGTCLRRGARPSTGLNPERVNSGKHSSTFVASHGHKITGPLGYIADPGCRCHIMAHEPPVNQSPIKHISFKLSIIFSFPLSKKGAWPPAHWRITAPGPLNQFVTPANRFRPQVVEPRQSRISPPAHVWISFLSLRVKTFIQVERSWQRSKLSVSSMLHALMKRIQRG